MLRTLYRSYVNKRRAKRVTEGSTSLNILKSFPLFETNGWGYYPIRAQLTIECINQTIPALAVLATIQPRHEEFRRELTDRMSQSDPSFDRLAQLFTAKGSDKSVKHDYHRIYATLLSSGDQAAKIFEIGLGSNNLDIVANMGLGGSPGASLRAFREFCPHAEVFGADFDTRVLFEEERIRTFFVDQTKSETFLPLGDQIGDQFDLMIDDGLHAPNVNLHSLNFFLPRLRVGGYAVVEDIIHAAKPVWDVVSGLLNENYRAAFIPMKCQCVYVVQRLR